MGLGRFWLKHGPGTPGAIAKVMAQSYSNLRRTNPELSHEQLLTAALNQRYSVIAAVSPLEQEQMLREADGNIVKLIVSIVQHENPGGFSGAARDFSVYNEMVTAIEEVLEKHLRSEIGPRGPRKSA